MSVLITNLAFHVNLPPVSEDVRYFISFILWTESVLEARVRCSPDSCPSGLLDTAAGHGLFVEHRSGVSLILLLDRLLCFPHFVFSPFLVYSLVVVDQVFWNLPNKLHGRQDFGVVL